MKCLLIKNADVYAPQPLGIVDILIINDKIAKIGQQLITYNKLRKFNSKR